MRHKSSILFSSVCFEVYVEVEAESLSVNYEQHVFDVTPMFFNQKLHPFQDRSEQLPINKHCLKFNLIETTAGRFF